MNNEQTSLNSEDKMPSLPGDSIIGGEIYRSYQAQARKVMTPADVEQLAGQMRGLWLNILYDKLPQDKSARIYEAGCGPGAFLYFLSSLGYKNILGSDISETQVKIARSFCNNIKLTDSVEDIEKITPATIDCIVAFDFIEHLERNKAICFLAACSRALKKGGILIMRMPNGDSPFVGKNFFNDPTHFWAYTTVIMRALLEIAEFSEIEFRDESEAGVQRFRAVKIPLMRLTQWLVKVVIRAATREQIHYLSPSIFVFAKK